MCAVAGPWGDEGGDRSPQVACKICYQTILGALNHTKIDSSRGFAPDLTGGA